MRLRTLVVSLFLFALFSAALAQTSRGTLTGTVTDSTGAVVSSATVKITHKETGVSRETTTNSSGIYRFDAVDLGTYTVSVQGAGFGPEDKTGVDIQASRASNVDFSLKPGTTKEVLTVEASGIEIGLDTTQQVRGDNFSALTIQNLPVLGGDSLTLTQLAPGVSLASGNSINQNGTLNFIVNGQRPRGNNFMIDGVENNDISVTGPAFTISNPDAVQEISVQTADFSAEYGRAGGAIINQVTKSGTSELHGSAAYVYTGSAFAALNHLQRVQGLTDAPRQVRNIPDFTIGGPVVIPKLYNGRQKTFFFAAAQWDRLYGKTSSANALVVPTDAGVVTLQALAPQCPNAALYLKALGSFRGDPNVAAGTIPLDAPSAAGTCNGSARTGVKLNVASALRNESFAQLDNNHLIKIDHMASDKQTMSFRWLYDSSTSSPSLQAGVLPGFDNGFTGLTLTGSFVDTYVINSRSTNEFRFNYGRIGFNFPGLGTDSFHQTEPAYLISGISGFGLATNIPQFRFANNWQYQDTVTVVRGKHTFRFGADFLRQLARQHPPFNERGSFSYSASAGVTAFSNFLDDFGGSGGTLNRQFGSSIYHPDLFRQSYFGQDSWKVTSNLTLNIGLRYEYYGAPENTFTVAAFTNYDPVNFAAPRKVPPYKLNLGPSVGFAWSPKAANWVNRMMGGEKMVWRGGFQTSYDSSFNNLLSNIAGSSPNTLGGVVNSTGGGRGAANFSTLFAGIQATPATAQSAQSNLFLGSFPNPQTDRWSLGFERELPYGLFWGTSYVGSVSHHLYQSLDLNPFVAPGVRFHPEVGQRTVRAASANSNYEALQIDLRRSFKATPIGQVQFQGSYTYAHYLDNISDVFGFDSTPNSFESAPQVLGFSPRLDYGNSDFDRRHVGALGFFWSLPGPKNMLLGEILGGWNVSGVAHWQTGFPYTVINGPDRGGFGQASAERPDISNINAPLNTRAIKKPSCATGFGNPDATGVPCIDPSTVHFIEGSGVPNARTVGRNTLFAPGLDNLDLSVAKQFRFTEKTNLEYRVDMFNAFNTNNLGTFVAPRTVNGSTIGQFLDFTRTNSVARTMRMRLKFTF
ncbi:MAG TPA: carboxypeptidase regulatory-like domain-containing protein [Verrucomicrobiae bacterium]|jgi:outer membrane receptor protein involved in Fe transport|nr:carboxypeptidase regulatory-like domain-containing protein [Verrucomicrobiae bacterium]